MSSDGQTGTHDPITIEYRGRSYRGHRVVSGTRRVTQRIYYGTRSRDDTHAYKPSEGEYMESIARIILRELVEDEGRGGEVRR